MKEIQKSLPIIRAEFDTQLRMLVNSTKLPFCVIAPVLKDVYFEVSAMADSELKVEVERYTNAMKNNEEAGSE
jgi:hypothetical protein